VNENTCHQSHWIYTVKGAYSLGQLEHEYWVKFPRFVHCVGPHFSVLCCPSLVHDFQGVDPPSKDPY
jgi:hypothetical protein